MTCPVTHPKERRAPVPDNCSMGRNLLTQNKGRGCFNHPWEGRGEVREPRDMRWGGGGGLRPKSEIIKRCMGCRRRSIFPITVRGIEEGVRCRLWSKSGATEPGSVWTDDPPNCATMEN